MNNELELITTDAPELARVVTAAALEPTTGERLIRGFAPFFKDAKSILDVSRTITVTDATQVTEIKASRENRLKLRAVRIAADKVRKELKEDSMKLGNGIQSVYNLLVLDIEKEEKRLQEGEDFAARAEAARKEQLKTARTAELVNADALADLTGYDLAAMSDASFASLMESFKRAVSDRKAAAERAEAERAEAARLAAEEAARKEAERLAAVAEAQRIAAELAKVEAAAAEERRLAKIEAERLAEESRLAREEAARLAKIEADRKAAEEKAKREAAAAPDKAKLSALVAAIRALPVPALETSPGLAQLISEQREKFAVWVAAQSAKL